MLTEDLKLLPESHEKRKESAVLKKIFEEIIAWQKTKTYRRKRNLKQDELKEIPMPRHTII